jgi:hypothetical protein
MGMLAGFRDAVWGHAQVYVVDAGDIVLHPEIPGDVSSLPCLVVGLPSSAPAGLDGAEFTPTCDVYVIAHPAETPGRDTALLARTDAVFDHFGGTRGVRVADPDDLKWHLTTGPVTPRIVTVGDLDYPAYLLTIESAYRTC